MKQFLLLAAFLVVVAGQGRFLSKPDPQLCVNRPKHFEHNGHWYFFSSDIDEYKGRKVDWLDARNECRKRCMDAVGMESESENRMIFDFIKKRDITYIWTSGRLCDFKDCKNRTDLLPLDVKGWFWSISNTKMSDTNRTPPGWGNQPWSQTGHNKAPQPDNAEFSINQTPESCMAVLNNVYDDGIKWHDIGCYHKKPFICEDSDLLINFVDFENPELRLKANFRQGGFNQPSNKPAPSQNRFNQGPSQNRFNQGPSQNRFNQGPSQNRFNQRPNQNRFNQRPNQNRFPPNPFTNNGGFNRVNGFQG